MPITNHRSVPETKAQRRARLARTNAVFDQLQALIRRERAGGAR